MLYQSTLLENAVLGIHTKETNQLAKVENLITIFSVYKVILFVLLINYINVTLFRVSQDQLILDWGDALIDFNDIPAPSPVSKTPEESTNLVNLENAMGKLIFSKQFILKKLTFRDQVMFLEDLPSPYMG